MCLAAEPTRTQGSAGYCERQQGGAAAKGINSGMFSEDHNPTRAGRPRQSRYTTSAVRAHENENKRTFPPPGAEATGPCISHLFGSVQFKTLRYFRDKPPILHHILLVSLESVVPTKPTTEVQRRYWNMEELKARFVWGQATSHLTNRKSVRSAITTKPRWQQKRKKMPEDRYIVFWRVSLRMGIFGRGPEEMSEHMIDE